MSQIESVACDDRIKNILHYHYMVMGCSLRKSRKAKGPYAQGLIEFMAKKHGFVRNKGQYERLFNKWGWKKNHSSQVWQDVKGIVEHHLRRGLHPIVYEDGRLVPQETLQKEFGRNAFKPAHERYMASQVVCNTIHPAIAKPLRFEILTGLSEATHHLYFNRLPMLEFQKHVVNLSLHQQTSLSNFKPSSFLSQLCTSQTGEHSTIDGLLPETALLQLTTRFSGLANKEAIADLQQLSLINFLLSNNLPGDANGDAIYRWMKQEGGTKALTVLSNIKFPGSGSLKEGLFRLAVETGDADAVKLLLQHGVSPRGHQCRNFHHRYLGPFSAFQLALLQGDLQIGRMLLDTGEFDVMEEENTLGISLLALVVHGGSLGQQDKCLGPHDRWVRSRLEAISSSEPCDNATNSTQHGTNIRQKSTETVTTDARNTTHMSACYDLTKELIERGACPTFRACQPPNETAAYFKVPSLILTAAAEYFDASFLSLFISMLTETTVNGILARESSLALLEYLQRLKEVTSLYFQEQFLAQEHFLDQEHKGDLAFLHVNKNLDFLLNVGAATVLIPGSEIPATFAYRGGNLSYTATEESLNMAIAIGNLPFVQELLARGVPATTKCLGLALTHCQRTTFNYLLGRGVTDITWDGMQELMKHTDALNVWLLRMTDVRPKLRMRRIIVLTAIMLDSRLLMTLIKSWGSFESVLASTNDVEMDIDGKETFQLIGSQTPNEYESIHDVHEYAEEYDDCLQEAMSYHTGDFVILEELHQSGFICTKTFAKPLHDALREFIAQIPHRPSIFEDMDENSTEPIIFENRHQQVVERLIRLGVDLNMVQHVGERNFTGSILVNAVLSQHNLLIHMLIDAGADVQVSGIVDVDHAGIYDDLFLTPLQAAIFVENRKWIKYFAGDDSFMGAMPLLNGFFNYSENPFWDDIYGGNTYSFNALLRHGADAVSTCSHNFSRNEQIIIDFWHTVFESRKHLPTDKSYRTPLLHLAIENEQTRAVAMILKTGIIDIDYIWKGKSPLGLAIDFDDQEIVQLLLDAGAQTNALSCRQKDQTWTTPLHLAMRCGCSEVASLLLQRGADPNASMMVDGLPFPFITCLHEAVNRRSLEDVNQLLAYKANPNPPRLQDANLSRKEYRRGLAALGEIFFYTDNTPLQMACQRGHNDIAEALIAHGAHVNATASDEAGATALQYATMHGFMGIVFLLLENGADVNAPGAISDGRTALEAAAEHGRIDILMMLLNAGAKIHGEGEAQYESSLRYASKHGHHSLRELLEAEYLRTSVHFFEKLFELQANT